MPGRTSRFMPALLDTARSYHPPSGKGGLPQLSRRAGSGSGSGKSATITPIFENTAPTRRSIHFAGWTPRYYDPATGQFLTTDPIEDVTGDSYGYAGGNPIMNTDPTGLDWRESVATASAGFGDAISFGLLKGVRNNLGGGVDECSTAYRGGQVAGEVAQFARSGGLTGLRHAMRSPYAPSLGFAGRHTPDQRALVELAKETSDVG